MLRLHFKRHTSLLTPRRRHVVAKKQQQQININQQHYQKNYVINPKSLLCDLKQQQEHLHFNQRFNQRIIFNLELYHKNIFLKKSLQTFYKKSKRQYLCIKIS
ncbi:hypothetical protein CVS40_5110 [Lucilia cuprina]|nr:hypothetical protein CVS40_5110 [Lucilia cuprina]